jgi:hypothetical protein
LSIEPLWFPTHFANCAKWMGHGIFSMVRVLGWVGLQVSEARPGAPGVLLKLATAYLMMTTFMLHGVRVRVMGRVCAPRLVVVGGAQVLVPDGSGGVPVGEPDRS